MIQKGCRPGFVQLFLEEQPVRLNKCFKNTQLHSWKFRKHLLSQLQKIDDLSEKSGILKQTKRKLEETDMIGNVQHDLLQILSEHEIEAWNVAFDWGEMWISVDTIPAIEIPKGQMEEFERSQRDLLFHDQTHKRGAFGLEQNYYLVPKGCQKDDNEEGCGCWLIDFAPAEVAILRAMDKTHRDCHKFLKYILKNGHDLPSYLVKSAVLKHLGNCTGSSSEEICTLEILNYILKCVDDAFLPDPFLRNLNAFGWKEFDYLRPCA
ncbi:unnamed protein product [Mytilus edulis]|uniref:Mab-21-like HhH/H2TH-like domain-containing protein n=1 Tax=Mytilus edulis TaxID=6550 RepID=A0A8S3T9J6_MYTED|nr:unnamed protein product [Mytilus edulis]